jgi:His/Glu/Gln/Arg/opine family amino acid ABC transporter permease subunit
MGGFWETFWHELPRFLPPLLVGFQLTLTVAVGSFVLAMSAGLMLAIGKMSRVRLISLAASTYIEVIRGTPALTQLFIIYFGLAQYGINLPGLAAAIIGLGLNGAAYVAEIFRAGLKAVPDGQRQAALSLGLTPVQTFQYILVPQAFRTMLPPFCSYAVQLLKDTSLASVVAAPEIMFRARMLVSETYLSMQIYLLVGLMYLAVSIPLGVIGTYLQNRGFARRPALAKMTT